MPNRQAAPATTDKSNDWREDYAYTLGTQAHIFGFPYIYLPTLLYLPTLRWNWVTVPKPAGGITPVYFNTTKDASGQTLDSSKNYTLRFPPGQLPNVKAFWSITLYDPTYNLTPNSIDRYSIGNRTTGVKADADGGLTVYIQNISPGQEKEANWLPSPQSGRFMLVLRTYLPGKEIVEQTWSPPGVAPA